MSQPPHYSLTLLHKAKFLRSFLSFTSYSTFHPIPVQSEFTSVLPLGAVLAPLTIASLVLPLVSTWAWLNSWPLSCCFTSRLPSQSVAKQEGGSFEGKEVEIIEESCLFLLLWPWMCLRAVRTQGKERTLRWSSSLWGLGGRSGGEVDLALLIFGNCHIKCILVYSHTLIFHAYYAWNKNLLKMRKFCYNKN